MSDPKPSEAATPEARRELLRRLLEQKAAEPLEQAVSAQQERLWVAHHLDPQDPSQNLRSALEIEGDLDPEALERAFANLASRHEQLRASFQEVSGRPVARISPTHDTPIERLSSTANDPQRIETLVREIAARPFDLAAGPLVRMALIERSSHSHVAVLVVHHIVCDAWSMDLLLRDLLSGYSAELTGSREATRSPASHRDYADRQRALLDGTVGEAQRSFWRTQLGTYAGAPRMPWDGERPAGTQMAARRLPFELGDDLAGRVEALARSRGSTAYMVLLTAFGTLLGRLGGTSDLVVASPSAGRQEEAWESIVGYFVNLLPIRLTLDPEAGFEQALLTTRRRVLEAQENTLLPVHQMAEAAGQRPTDLVRVLFQHVAAPAGRLHAGHGAARITVESRPIDLGRTRQDLSLTTFAGDGALRGILEHSELLSPESADRLIEELGRLLEAITEDPSATLGTFAISSDWRPATDPQGVPAPSEATRSAGLAEPAVEPSAGTTEGGDNDTQAALVAIWQDLLELDDVTPFDNFLDIGGDSLLAMQAIDRIEAQLGVRVAPGDLFTQTLMQLAASLEARRG